MPATTDEGERPLVSVVLPTYERGSVIDDAIESVLDQTYDDLELVVVDGGSTDATAAVVEGFDDRRVRYHRRAEPAGVSAARNAGVALTSGDVVAFVDADDRWRADKLARQVEAYEDGHSVVYCGLRKAGDDGEARRRSGASGDVFEEVLSMSVPTYTSTLLVDRAAFERAGGFDEALPCFEDWELCLRLARETTFAFVDGPLVVKGTGEDSLSGDPERLAEAVDRLDERYDLPAATRARLLADVGITHCEAGRLADARPYLRRALAADPSRGKAAVALAFAVAGSQTAFDAGMGALYDAERTLSRVTARLTA